MPLLTVAPRARTNWSGAGLWMPPSWRPWRPSWQTLTTRRTSMSSSGQAGLERLYHIVPPQNHLWFCLPDVCRSTKRAGMSLPGLVGLIQWALCWDLYIIYIYIFVWYVVRRLGQGQGLLYKHLRNYSIQQFILCANIFTAPPLHNDWRCCFHS